MDGSHDKGREKSGILVFIHDFVIDSLFMLPILKHGNDEKRYAESDVIGFQSSDS